MAKRIFALCMVVMALFATVSFANEPQIYGKSAILMDMDTGRILYEKNIDEKVYPASTTKIMTAILVLEEYGDRLDEIVVAGPVVDEITGTGASNIGILQGEELTVEQLLHAVLVASANEACDVLAEHMCNGNVDEFVMLMNKKAEELGMENTHFVNTHGYHDDEHYTTARDMATLARYAMGNEKFREIVKKTEYIIPQTNKYFYNGGERTLSNTNNIIRPGHSGYYKYATGIKTGFTTQAGNCLVAAATKESTKTVTKSETNLIAATFDSENENNASKKDADVKELFEYGYDKFSIMSVSVPNEDVGEVKVFAGKGTDSVTAVVATEVKALLPVDVDIKKDIIRTYHYYDNVKAPVGKGQVVGSVSYTYADAKTGEIIELGTADLVAKTDVEKNFIKQLSWFLKKVIFNWFIFFPLILFLLIIAILAYRRKLRRKRRRQFLRNRRYGR